MLLLGNSSLPLCWYTLWEHFNVVPVISEYFIITSREWNLSVTLGLILQHHRVHGFCISRKKIAQQGEGALKCYQETSTSVPCSRVHFPSLRSTSEVLVSLKPWSRWSPCALWQLLPQLGKCLHLHSAGVAGTVRYVERESGAPFLTWVRRSPEGCVPAREGSRQLFPGISLVPWASKAPLATLVLFCTPLSQSHPKAMMSTGKMCSFK